MDVNSNIVDLFPNQGEVVQPRGYRAIEADESQDGKGTEEWFRVHGDPDNLPQSVELFRYVDILKVYAPLPELLMIACQDAAFHIEGEYLEVIPALIQDRKLRALTLFDPYLHDEPDDDEPIILAVERVSMVEETADEFSEDFG